jgi:dimethylhistidine N-methyltransferase
MSSGTTTITDTNLKTFANDVKSGLEGTPKTLSSKYFYNDKGDKLFQLIMKLPEYYPTRSEYEILSTRKQEMLKLFHGGGDAFQLIEFGAGDGTKTKVLLKHLVEQQVEFIYLPIDISANVLRQLKDSLAIEIPQCEVITMPHEYFDALERINAESKQRKVILFLGSNIGNFTGERAHQFLQSLAHRMNPNDLLMLGMDLMKDPKTILAAYNDSQGITREFNLNLLDRINEELGGNFNRQNFTHYPTYNPITGETKSYIVSTRKQQVHITALDQTYELNAWEAIQTELSQKYDLPTIDKLAEGAGLHIKSMLFDCKHWFVDVVLEKK